jgi:hypothetical protein
MSPFRYAVLALAITAPAYADAPAPVALTGGELGVLCTSNVSTIQKCFGYIAGVSDELEITAKGAGQTLGADAAALAPCPGKQMAELVTSTLAELNAGPDALSAPALTAVELALHLPLGCHGSHPSSSTTLFADGALHRQ